MKTKAACYYNNYGLCTCSYAENSGKGCAGEGCRSYISENDYFDRMMKGTLDELIPKEDARKTRLDLESKLRPAKTKKQIKREEKKNAGDGTGFKLGDDPAFRNLFEKGGK